MPPRAGAGPDLVHDVEGFVHALDQLRRRAAGPAEHRVGLDQIARRTGIPRSSLHAYLSGEVLPPADRLDAVVIALGAPPAETRAWADALDRLRDVALTRRRTASAHARPGLPNVAAGAGNPAVLQVYSCVTWMSTPVFAGPTSSAAHTGMLFAGNSWVVRQMRGGPNPPIEGAAPNDIWLYTQADDARHDRDGWGWIPASVVQGARAGGPLPVVPWTRARRTLRSDPPAGDRA